MRIAIFTHSARSCWNHGNAHFLRGISRELIARGHDVVLHEPRGAWSVENLLADGGPEALDAWRSAYPELVVDVYDPRLRDLDARLDGVDLVLVHEWNDHALVAELGRRRRRGARFRLLFHDTHHRSVTAPEEMRAYDLSGYDGVVTFGEAISEVYRSRGWSRRVWTVHEAADVRLFRPLQNPKSHDLVWIGNWGDDERSRELVEFLIEPAQALSSKTRIHGVRYPEAARRALADAGVEYAGWLPNHRAPEVFSTSRATVHVPRRPYVEALPGIPTIRVFEALACAIPLVSAPWRDVEGLFTPGEDFLVARDGAEMKRHLRDLLHDDAYARAVAAHGLATLRARHTCAHRADSLLAIARALDAPSTTSFATTPGAAE